MPIYKYTAIDTSGNRTTKTVVANSKNDVTNFLIQNHFFIVEITEATKGHIKAAKQLRPQDKINFTQNIAVLLSSGISLGESVAIIAEDASSKATSAFFRTVQSDLERGLPLSKALANYPTIFDPVYLALVEAGENSGQLDTIMQNLGKSLEKDLRMRSQVKSALLYPAFVLASLAVLGSLIAFFVLPRITRVFEQLNVTLPLTTRLLVEFSHITGKYPLLILGILLLLVGGFSVYFHAKQGKEVLAKLSLRMPFVKQIIYNLDLSHLSSTLSLLMNAGVPIQQAMQIASGTIRNPRLSQEVKQAADKLATGTSLAQTLNNTTLPRTFIALVAVGERSGNIAKIFNSLAEHYDSQLDTSIKNFTGIIEPVLTLVVGVLVGGVVITIMVPIYQFLGNIQSVQ